MSANDMHRSESASSSATAHPLEHTEEPKPSSSSTSSSPTFQSNSSSAHKTNSTIASSLQTTGSRSSFQAAGNKILLHEGSSVPPAFARANGPQANSTSSTLTAEEGTSGERNPRAALHKTHLWEERRYAELEDDSYSVHDEESPIKYPPFSEEEQEARRVEQKLEQWAAQERSRRKAKRSSRTSSMLLTQSSNSKLSKRMSMLGQLANGNRATGQSSLTEPTAAAFGDDHGSSTANGAPYGKRNSLGSTDALVGTLPAFRDASASSTNLNTQRGDSVDSSDTESGTASAHSNGKAKGKSRELSDPFQDPQPVYTKPSARNPIVTPGRAPTIRHRALERARNNIDKGMPAIVATDADEEQEARSALDRFNSLDDDPFQSASERKDAEAAAAAAAGGAKRPTIKTNVSSYTIGSTIDEASPDTPLPKRKSTNSRFNEIGLDDEEDAAGWPLEEKADSTDATPRLGPRKYGYNDRTMQRSSYKMRGVEEEPAPRAPWWTEWLCGCGSPSDADLEQSGRTFPE